MKAPRQPKRIPGIIFLVSAIFLLAFVVRLLPLQEYHTGDETAYLQHAERIVSGKANYDELGFRPPMLPLFIAAGFVVWHSPHAASVIVALLAASITIALFLIARRLFGDTAGIFAALIAAVHPVFVEYGHLVLTDAVVASFLAFAILLALDDSPVAAFAAGIVAGIGALTKFSGLAALPVLLVFIAWQHSSRLRDAALFAAGCVVALLPFMLWSQAHEGGLLTVFAQGRAIVNAYTGSNMAYANLQLFSIPLLLGIILFILLASKRSALRSTDAKTANAKTARGIRAFIILAVSWLAIMGGYLLTLPVKDNRYLLPAIIVLLPLAGRGYAMALNSVKGEWMRRHGMWTAVAFIIALAAFAGVFARLSNPLVNTYVPPAVEVAQRIDALAPAPIFAVTDYPVLGYYTNDQVVVLDGPGFLQGYPRNMPRNGYLVINKDRLQEPTVGWADSQQSLSRVFENGEYVVYDYNQSLAR